VIKALLSNNPLHYHRCWFHPDRGLW